MFKLYQSAVRSVFSEDTSKNIRDGPLSVIMGSKYTSSNNGVTKLITYIKDNDYLEIPEGSKIGYMSSYLNTLNSVPIVQFMGMNVKPKGDGWYKISLDAFNSRVPIIPVNFEINDNTNPDEYVYALLLTITDNIEIYINTFNIGSEMNSFIKSTSIRPSSMIKRSSCDDVYEHLVKHGIGLYHTSGCSVNFIGYSNYEFFDELSLQINMKNSDDKYKIGEWDDDMQIYRIDGSQSVDNQDITEQIINGDQYLPSLLIIKINVENNNKSIDDPSSYVDHKYYLIPNYVLRGFRNV